MSTYGYSAYDTGYYWNGAFYATPSQNLYGLQLYSQISVDPFVAAPRDYRTIMVTWTQPQGTWYEFRLVANRYGFPVDQNDGNILIDSTTYPGSIYADQNVIPGTYHYYAIYIRVNNSLPAVWQRCAFASCLAPADNMLGGRMFDMLPTYFREVGDTELTTDTAGNVYLQQFLNVIGWGMDYLKTQYDVLFNHLNDPMAIPLGDLVNLAAEVGMPFQPELPAYVMRKAVANWAHICQQRGTPGGISEHITLTSGYPIDLQSGRNKMLENDQAQPLHPAPAAWNANLNYNVGELVSYGNYIYSCLTATANIGNAPTGTTGANTWWTVQQNVIDPNGTLNNTSTIGFLNTWQNLFPALDAGGSYTPPNGTMAVTIGMIDPLNSSNNQHNAISLFNKAGSTQDMMVRSISQITGDRTGSNTSMAPDKLQVIKDGVPITRVNPSLNAWSSTVRYATNSIVLYDNAMYLAQRASTGAIPPTSQPLNANPYFETVTTPWTGFNSATIAQSNTQAFQGTYSLKVTPDGTHAQPGALSELVNAIPNAIYSVAPWVFIPAGWSNTQVYLSWVDTFGQLISSTGSASVNVAANTWTQIPLTATAPAGAATLQITLQLTGTPANTVVSYWDSAGVECVQTPEWALLSTDGRLRMMLSGYTTSPSGIQVIPYVEWYDDSGALITSNGQYRVVPRVTTPGTPGGPPSLSYDSFTIGIGTYLNGRELDTNDQQWQTQLGSFLISGYQGGAAYPSSVGTRSMAWITGPANTWLGVTFSSNPQAGQDAGIIFRAASTTSYWRAGMSGLYLITGGASSLIASYSTACSPGDRLTVNLNGSNITVYRNGVQVATTTNSTNSANTLHGIVVEATGV